MSAREVQPTAAYCAREPLHNVGIFPTGVRSYRLKKGQTASDQIPGSHVCRRKRGKSTLNDLDLRKPHALLSLRAQLSAEPKRQHHAERESHLWQG